MPCPDPSLRTKSLVSGLMIQIKNNQKNSYNRMPRSKKTKTSFAYDDQGRAILSTAKDMAAWVKMGFEEQKKRRGADDVFLDDYIDLTNCVLYISYPIGSKNPTAQIFNLCDMAGVVPGIEKIEGDPNYLYEVKKDILLNGSLLNGCFFHYVKFDGRVSMDNVTVSGTFSCFKCLFRGHAFMQRIHLTGGFTYEQCVFEKGLLMNSAKVGGIHAQLNYCHIKERLSLAQASITNQKVENYKQTIDIANSTIDNLVISRICTDGLPFYIRHSTIQGMAMDNVNLENVLFFDTCSLDGIITSVIEEDSPKNKFEKLVFHSCNVKAQYHIENSVIERFIFNFGKIDGIGRLRFAQCEIKELKIGASSVFGQIDIIENQINTIGLEENCVQGYLSFQDNMVNHYSDRQTLRLLKSEAIKVNDTVEATKLYAKEMRILLADKNVPFGDKVSLWISRAFSGFGEKWVRALIVTVSLSMGLTFIMLGFGSTKYGFDFSGEFMGLGRFVTSWLDSINVFSIPLFSDTIREYGLNVCGQILYFLIKVIVAYGSYQFVVAFRKYSRH